MQSIMVFAFLYRTVSEQRLSLGYMGTAHAQSNFVEIFKMLNAQSQTTVRIIVFRAEHALLSYVWRVFFSDVT